MSKVKFNVNTEYMYIQNFKVLQSTFQPTRNLFAYVLMILLRADTFAKHAIDKIVPVESLMKCKMQDNLEFLQFSKRYWDQYYPGGDYDAVARRRASGAVPSTGAGAPRAPGGGARRPVGGGAAPRTRTPQGG